MIALKRALISVYDKDGLLELAKFLQAKGVEIISTGGTFTYLKNNGINVIEISSITKFPEMLDGRVKTLHPNIHAGILAIRKNKKHLEAIRQHEIQPIDCVIVNLYPFFDKVKEKLSFEEKIEFIDIGGPTMLRAAAKNYQDVLVVCDKADYKELQQRIEANNISLDFQQYLASKVFNNMSAYDAAVSNFLSKDDMPKYYAAPFIKKQDLRYGENPHQKASFYTHAINSGALATFDILGGKELSYNNIKDVDIAWKVVCEFKECACCALKHNSPCGVAIGRNVFDAYTKAYAVDPVSIFGGIVAFNKKVDKKVAQELVKLFLEIVAAPAFDKQAIEILKQKKNLRILQFNSKPNDKYTLVSVDGGLLVQSEDRGQEEKWQVVTKVKPTRQEKKDLLFAMKVVKYVKSNAIVVASKGVAVGIAGGQVNRIWPTRDALTRGKGATVLASDAFFPFRDVVDEAAKAGIKAIIQPGGSIKDQESIDAANENKISMVLTGIRHFKH